MIVVDTDVLIAATAGDGTVRRTLLSVDEELVTLDGAFRELADHIPLLAARTRASREDLQTVYGILSDYVDEADFDDYEECYTGLEMAYPWAEVRELDLCALATATDGRVWTENDAFDDAGNLEVLDTDAVQREVVA